MKDMDYSGFLMKLPEESYKEMEDICNMGDINKLEEYMLNIKDKTEHIARLQFISRYCINTENGIIDCYLKNHIKDSRDMIDVLTEANNDRKNKENDN